jgi:orotidine-5'-phosphate decarboxylase
VPRTGKESLIVALDVPTINAALRLVQALDNVSFFKVGLQLFMTGELPKLLKALRQKELFVDLKVPGDIANTIGAVIDLCVDMGVTFLTLSESMPISAIRAAKVARDNRGSKNPEFLTVPFLSSLDRDDLQAITGEQDLSKYVLTRAGAALEAGCDGVVASGQEIRLCRNAFPKTTIVSPGIRPSGFSSDDHKRFTTPSEAIQLGADYLVVGRPILTSKSPRQAADAIIAEIDVALKEKKNAAASRSAHPKPGGVLMSPQSC